MGKLIRIASVVAVVTAVAASPAMARMDLEAMLRDNEEWLASAELLGADGEVAGSVIVTELAFPDEGDRALGVWASVRALEPGFHGFHIHATGSCEPDAEDPFSSAGGHLDPEGVAHGGHAGDLPSLRARDDGIALAYFIIDAFSVDELLDADGSAFVVHAGRDNFGNIPERYGVADDATLGTGDAGPRVACGVIRPGATAWVPQRPGSGD